MKKGTRRDFLRWAATGVVAVFVNQFLTSCGLREPPVVATVPPAQNITNSPSPSPGTITPGGKTPFAASTLTPTSSPAHYLAVARGNDAETLVRRAIESLGGMQRFVPQGARVVIKPNICVAYHSFEYAATTNPWVVAALVKLSLEAGAASVQVMDFPFGGTADQAYRMTGIGEQVSAAGGEMAVMSNFKFISTPIPNAVRIKNADIYSDILDADVLINVPIAKDHSLAQLTLGMKNLMGVIKDRPAMHRDLGNSLTDLASRVYPTLTIIDAIRVLMANGPTGGDLGDVKQMDTIIASPDIVAADAYAATLFGMQPEDLDYVKTGAERGLGRSDLRNLDIEEITANV